MRRVVHAQALHTRPSPRLSTGLLSVAVGGGVVGGGGSRFVARAITCASSASTVICARNTRVRGRHGAAGSQLRRESYSQNLQVGGAPLHDRSVPRFAAPVDVAAPVRSARPGAGGTVHRLRLDAEGVVPRRAAAGEQTSMWSSCWTTAFPSLPHRWTLLLPSGAPVRRRMAWSSGFTRFHSLPFLALHRQQERPLLLRQLRRHSAGQVLWWCGCKLPGLAFTVTSARWAKHEVFALRGAALAAAAGRTRRRSETASIPTPALGCQQLRRPKSEKSTKRRVDDAGESDVVSRLPAPGRWRLAAPDDDASHSGTLGARHTATECR